MSRANPLNAPAILPRALLFDMDGTLTTPYLDFDRMKREMGIPPAEPILEAMGRMDAPARRAAEEILLRHEEAAAGSSTLNPGCPELLDWAARRGLGVALITRNSRRSVATFLERHGMTFGARVTREDGRAKPHPEPLERACAILGVPPARAWMIGDSQYDVEAGLAAGCAAVWVSHGRPRTFAAPPWRVVRDLPQITALLRECRDETGEQ